MRQRLQAALDTDVCGVVLDIPGGAFAIGHARAAREAAELLAAGGLVAVLVVDAERDATLLQLEGYTGPTAPSLIAALAAACRPDVADAPGHGPAAPTRPSAVARALDDGVLHGVAGLGLRMRIGAVLAARAVGMTLVEYLVLGVLALRGPVAHADLARELAVPDDEVAAVLRRLAELGLVLPSDGHPRSSAITALGRELLLTPADGLARDLHTSVEGLDGPTRAAMGGLLHSWSAAQERHNGRLRDWIAGGSR